MLVTSRRSLILGIGSLVAAPYLVKASSLMPLRGYEMDPWMIGYDGCTGILYSLYNFENLAKMDISPNVKLLSLDQRLKIINEKHTSPWAKWIKVRKSELYVPDSLKWDSRELFLKEHLGVRTDANKSHPA